MKPVDKTKNKAGVRFVIQEDGTPTYLLEQQVNIEQLEWEARKAQTRYRREANLQAEQNYLYMLGQVDGYNRWVLPKDTRCPCGKHRGVIFYQNDKQLSKEALCPVSAWLTMYRKVLRDGGKWEDFLVARPLNKFLDNFGIGW